MIVPSARNIRYLKMCIISPSFEFFVNLSSLTCFFVLAFLFIKNNYPINNYKLTQIISEDFKEKEFRTYKTKQEFLSNTEFLVNELYEFDPKSNNFSINYFIPYGSIRLKKYHNNQCSLQLKDSRNLPKCENQNVP